MTRHHAVGVLALVMLLPGGTLAMQSDTGTGRLTWMTGCWVQTRGSRVVEEQWTSPRGGSMLGTSRTITDGRLTEFEFVLLKEANGTLVYEAHPSGQAGASFAAADVADGRVVFENTTHDFPQRIGYEKQGPDMLAAWIEGRAGERTRRIDFAYTRTACPGTVQPR